MNDDQATGLIRKLRDEADVQTRRLPPLDAPALLRASHARPSQLARHERETTKRAVHHLLPRLAAAAVVAVIAAALMVSVAPRPRTAETPEHLLALVDSLYEEHDYVIDEVSVHWQSGSDPYIEGVWSEVMSGIEEGRD